MTTQKPDQLRQKHGSDDNPFAAMAFSFNLIWRVNKCNCAYGRMSGTASGTIILHVAPEAAIGGPLALVQNGDRICLNAAARRLDLLVSDDEMIRRRAALQLPVTLPNRGYGKLFHDHVVQAPGGVDFDFLQGVDPADADARV